MCVGFVLLANCTFLDIFAYERCKARPPEFGGDELAGFKVTWVASSLMIVAMNKNGPSKRGVRGNVNTSFVDKDALGILPVRQTRTESWENRAIHGLQCLDDKRVRGRGGLDVMREGSVNEVNEEGRGKKGNPFILWCGGGE